jgi:hypothetical protein
MGFKISFYGYRLLWISAFQLISKLLAYKLFRSQYQKTQKSKCHGLLESYLVFPGKRIFNIYDVTLFFSLVRQYRKTGPTKKAVDAHINSSIGTPPTEIPVRAA